MRSPLGIRKYQRYTIDLSRDYYTHSLVPKPSFSGSDIRCQIGQYSFAKVQAVSYSVTREKAPIYTMGSPDVRSFSRNKRGIAGSLVWVNFDRHALLDLVYKLRGQFVANVDDLRPSVHDRRECFPVPERDLSVFAGAR